MIRAVEVIPLNPSIEPPRRIRLSKESLRLLRLVKGGSPYADRTGGAPGRRKREQELNRLKSRGLIKKNRDGFWRETRFGLTTLLLHSNR